LLGPVGVAYPSSRSVAVSSLAYHMLVGVLEEAGVGVRRYFLEDGEVIEYKRYRGSPGSNVALLVSLPYELLYVDMVRMLDSMGIPVLREARSEEHPIIIAGGPAVTANPLPVYDIVDAILVGELEPVVDRVVDALSKSSRSSRLRALSEVEGLLAPGFNGSAERVYVKDLDSAWYPVRQELPEDVEPIWGKAFLLETTRGCARGCRFCMEGYIFRPKRDRSFQTLKRLLEDGVEVNRVSKVSFYSLIFFDNPASDRILEHAISMGLETSVPSIRAETLTVERAKLIAEGGQRTITIAPETGSCVIAKAILKPIGPKLTLEAVENALEGGIKNIKLYLMTGFPGETDEDLKDTIEMAVEVGETVRRRGGVVKATVNPLMPKPQTPLQWLGFDVEGVERKLSIIRKELSKAGIEVSIFNPDWAVAEVAIGRSGVEMGRVIIEWARRGGGPRALARIARNLNINVEHYLKPWDPESTPPWHEVVKNPYGDLKILRREFKAYMDIISSRESSKLRIRECKL